LPKIKDANESLQKDIAAGRAEDVILDSSLDRHGAGDDDEEDEDEDEDMDGGEGKAQGQYIEMVRSNILSSLLEIPGADLF